MPYLGLTGLVMAYVALAILLLSLHLYTNWSWWFKAGATLALAFFYFITYSSIPQFLGWPTTHDIPKKFRLIAYSIDKEKGIYIWANAMRNNVELPTPRAYVLPYSESLHSKVEVAGAKMRKGTSVIGEIEDAQTSAPPKNSEQGTLRSNQLNVEFLDAPKGAIPEKN